MHFYIYGYRYATLGARVGQKAWTGAGTGQRAWTGGQRRERAGQEACSMYRAKARQDARRGKGIRDRG